MQYEVLPLGASQLKIKTFNPHRIMGTVTLVSLGLNGGNVGSSQQAAFHHERSPRGAFLYKLNGLNSPEGLFLDKRDKLQHLKKRSMSANW